VVKFNNKTVTFTVSAAWNAGASLDWLAVLYDDAKTPDASAWSCNSSLTLSPGATTAAYTANCINGIADVSLFVYDANLQNIPAFSGEIPASCQAPTGQKQFYQFSVPCSAVDLRFCAQTLCSSSAPSAAPTPGPTISSLASAPNCVQQARQDGASITSGPGVYATNAVEILAQTGSTVTFQVDNVWKAGSSISWIAVDYLSGTTATCPKVNDVLTSTPQYTATCVNGVASINVWVHDGLFTGYADVTSSIPARCQPSSDAGHKIGFTFSVPCNPADELFCGQTKSLVLPTNNVTCVGPIFEDYETAGQAESWQSGISTYDSKLTNFLGRLGNQLPVISKTFFLPTSASQATIAFDLYDIDGINNSDTIYVGLQGSFYALNIGGADGTTNYNGIAITKTTTATFKTAFDATIDDAVFKITITVPSRFYATNNYQLQVAIKVVTAQPIEQESYGVDNFQLSVSCATRRDLENLEAPETEPSEDGEDGSYYCSAKDFPCGEGGTMVHVCHYSARLGYQTFCIPEPDSEVLRFYSSDYCGPCVGGFGGVNMQQ
jgi:hypothetical protein